MAGLAPAYTPRRPTETALYGLVREHMARFLRWTRETYDKPLPRYVEDELRRYLRCGVFAHGFVRAHCDACGHELLVAFSCHGRAVCPSCSGRRMASTAAHLVDRVLPPVAVRQFVLSLPFELRPLAAFKADVLTALSRIFVESIFVLYRARARRAGLPDSQCGAVTFVQRFGSSLNLNVHFHVVVLDGVFTREEDGRALFHPAPPQAAPELAELLARVEARTLAWLRRRGLFDDTPLEARSNEGRVDDALGGCAAVALARGAYERLPTQDDHGDDEPEEERTHGRAALAVDLDGFNLHAGVHIEAHDDLGRERLCRYGARPPLALDRLRRLRDGRFAYRVKYARRGRAKHRVMTPMELLARLSALIPPPRYPLVRYHGVLAPKSSWRKAVVPAARAAESAATSPCGRGKAREAGGHRVEKKKEPSDHESKSARKMGDAIAAAELAAPNMLRVQHWERLRGGALYAASPRVDWAKLLRRTFDVDVLVCPTCSGRLRVLGAVTDAAEARELLERLGLPADAPTTARARDPTADDPETGTDAWYADG